jgi:hypothetical protein
MIRFFDWRDMGLVKTLGQQGVCLDAEAGLIHGNRPLQEALLAFLMPGTGAPTLVWRNSGREAFGQLRHRLGEEQARLLFIAPHSATLMEGWLNVVEQLAAEAGRRGAHNLIAEVSEESTEFEALRLAGFAVYARQSLWKLSGPIPDEGELVLLHPATSADAIGISTLYANIVPRLVQQVEPGPGHRRGYVLKRNEELIAFLDVRRGPLGLWIEPCFHPEAYDLATAVLNTCLHAIPNRNDRPVYVCVRRYQDWLQEVLARGGFEAIGSQAVMVKRLVKRVTEPLKARPAIEGQVPTTPVMRVQTLERDQEKFSARPRGGRRSNDYAKANYRRLTRADGGDPHPHWGGADRRQPHRRPA